MSSKDFPESILIPYKTSVFDTRYKEYVQRELLDEANRKIGELEAKLSSIELNGLLEALRRRPPAPSPPPDREVSGTPPPKPK